MKENKGITLVALIITIIILLILAVVTISAVNEGSLFAHANNAATLYQERQAEENRILYELLGKMPNQSGSEEQQAGNEEPSDPCIGKTITEYYISGTSVASDVVATDFNGETCTYNGVSGIEYEIDYDEGILSIKDNLADPTELSIIYLTEHGNIIFAFEGKLLTTDGATDISGLDGWSFESTSELQPRGTVDVIWRFNIDSTTGIGILTRNSSYTEYHTYAILADDAESAIIAVPDIGFFEITKVNGEYSTISGNNILSYMYPPDP